MQLSNSHTYSHRKFPPHALHCLPLDVRVAEAFLKPAANMDTTSFDWPLPKLHRVRNYCREQLGWTELEMDQQVDTVIERYANRSHQVPPFVALCYMIRVSIALHTQLVRASVCAQQLKLFYLNVG
jgi:hypothetical protein